MPRALRARAISDRQLDSIRQRVEDALSADTSKRLVTRGADSVVHVSVDDFEAKVNDNVIYETHYVKIGERQEWDAKKKQNVTKDVYGNKSEPVRVRNARGRIGAHQGRVQVVVGARAMAVHARHPLEDLAGARIAQRAADRPAALVAVLPLHHVVARVERIGALGEQLGTEGAGQAGERSANQNAQEHRQ